MKKIILIFIIINSFQILNSQSFSFFDNFEFYIRPFEYVIDDWGKTLTPANYVGISIYNPLEENLFSSKYKFATIKHDNYFTQEYGIRYYLKAHNNFKIGLGANYKRRKLEYDVFIPNNDIVIYALRYKAKYDYFGFSLNFRMDIPSIKSNINFYWELNYPLNKDNRKPELTVFYSNSYVLFIQTQHSIPNSIIDGPNIGFDFSKALYKDFYLNFHFSYKYFPDYFSRVFYYKIEENKEAPSLIFRGIARSRDFVIGIGIVYQIPKKDKLKEL